MLYRLEQKTNGDWRLLKEVANMESWREILSTAVGSYRLVDTKSGLVVREVHIAG